METDLDGFAASRSPYFAESPSMPEMDGRNWERILAAADGPSPQETRYLYGGQSQWQVIEEQDAQGVTLASYVWGRYIDELVSMRRCPPGQTPVGSNLCSGGGPPVDYYFHADDNYNIMALTNSAGAVAERYEYGDFGQPQFLNSVGGPATHPCPASPDGTCSRYGNPYLFTGREYDPESTLYHYRTRYLDSVAGRFITRDTIGTWGDGMELGNGQSYVANSPWTYIDPLGEETIPVDGGKWQRFEGESKDSKPSPHQRFGDHYYNKETGERYYPERGKILGPDKKWRDASSKFTKNFREAYDRRWKGKGPGPIDWGKAPTPGKGPGGNGGGGGKRPGGAARGAAAGIGIMLIGEHAQALETFAGELYRQLLAAIARGDLKAADRIAQLLFEALMDQGLHHAANNWWRAWDNWILPELARQRADKNEADKIWELGRADPVPAPGDPPNPTEDARRGRGCK